MVTLVKLDSDLEREIGILFNEMNTVIREYDGPLRLPDHYGHKFSGWDLGLGESYQEFPDEQAREFAIKKLRVYPPDQVLAACLYGGGSYECYNAYTQIHPFDSSHISAIAEDSSNSDVVRSNARSWLNIHENHIRSMAAESSQPKVQPQVPIDRPDPKGWLITLPTMWTACAAALALQYDSKQGFVKLFTDQPLDTLIMTSLTGLATLMFAHTLYKSRR